MHIILGLDEIRLYPYTRSSYTPPKYPHSHDFFEISFCVSGSSVNTVNGKPIPFQNGVCVILRPTDIHSVTEYSDTDYEHIDFYATKEKFVSLCNSCQAGLYDKIMSEKGPLYFTMNNETFSFLFNKVLLLKDMIGSKKDNCALMHASLITMILSEYVSQAEDMNEYKPDWLKEILPKFNDINFLQKNVTLIARETGFSLPYFSSQFKKYMGVSAIEYLTRKRVHLSKSLLVKGSQLRILDISSMLGFENPSTFSKHFVEEFKITPKEFKKQSLVNY